MIEFPQPPPCAANPRQGSFRPLDPPCPRHMLKLPCTARRTCVRRSVRTRRPAHPSCSQRRSRRSRKRKITTRRRRRCSPRAIKTVRARRAFPTFQIGTTVTCQIGPNRTMLATSHLSEGRLAHSVRAFVSTSSHYLRRARLNTMRPSHMCSARGERRVRAGQIASRGAEKPERGTRPLTFPAARGVMAQFSKHGLRRRCSRGAGAGQSV